jgi:WD40 repeat protein
MTAPLPQNPRQRCGAAFLLVAVGCSGSEPSGPPTGNVQVTASTKGWNVDPDGYMVALDGGAEQALAVNGGMVTFSQVHAGDHSVDLSGLAPNCAVSGPDQQAVSVTAEATAQAAFQIACPQLAFTSDRDGNSEIYVMNADGTGLINLTNNPAFDGYPAWSPDGSKIAFDTNRDGNREVYVMSADGTGPINVTKSPAFDGHPAWSPDGSRITFTSGRDRNAEIYVMDADGTGLVNLTNNPGEDSDPAWRP